MLDYMWYAYELFGSDSQSCAYNYYYVSIYTALCDAYIQYLIRGGGATGGPHFMKGGAEPPQLCYS
jgi:hypothetical protein